MKPVGNALNPNDDELRRNNPHQQSPATMKPQTPATIGGDRDADGQMINYSNTGRALKRDESGMAILRPGETNAGATRPSSQDIEKARSWASGIHPTAALQGQPPIGAPRPKTPQEAVSAVKPPQDYDGTTPPIPVYKTTQEAVNAVRPPANFTATMPSASGPRQVSYMPTATEALNARIPGYASLPPSERAAALRAYRASGNGQVPYGQVVVENGIARWGGNNPHIEKNPPPVNPHSTSKLVSPASPDAENPAGVQGNTNPTKPVRTWVDNGDFRYTKPAASNPTPMTSQEMLRRIARTAIEGAVPIEGVRRLAMNQAPSIVEWMDKRREEAAALRGTEAPPSSGTIAGDFGRRMYQSLQGVVNPYLNPVTAGPVRLAEGVARAANIARNKTASVAQGVARGALDEHRRLSTLEMIKRIPPSELLEDADNQRHTARRVY